VAATVRELASLIRGTLEGDGDLMITDARSLKQAGQGHITFLEDERQAERLQQSAASAIVVPTALAVEGRTVIRSDDPLAAFIAIVQHIRGREPAPPVGIDPRAVVHPTVTMGAGSSVQALAVVGEGTVMGARCRIHPGAVVGRNCRFGDDVVIHANAVLYDGTVAGNRVIIHANTVIGADGFGYRQVQGKHVKVPQLGYVELEDDVEIGACATIDRGTFDATRIGTGTKIDNLVMIAHNCQIGPHNILVAQVGMAGSSSTGSHVIMAGQVGITDHIHIGDQAILGARAGVACDVPPKSRYLGAPAIPEAESKRIVAGLYRLPEIRRDIKRIKAILQIEAGEEEEAA
jgi:UDP-3-O-[3-hydroxymyristoyl] glucosamine N-acyltransferase